MTAVQQVIPSIDPTSELLLAAEARKADGLIVTANVRPSPRVGTSADASFVGNSKSLNTVVSRVLPNTVCKVSSTRVNILLGCRIVFHHPYSIALVSFAT